MRPIPDLARDARMYASRLTNRSLAPPDWLSINLTLRCNLACAMCTTCYDAPELAREEVFDLIDQAAVWGVKVFNPLGGEPFIRLDLEEILAYAARRDFQVTLTTNATLITRPRADHIAAIPADKLHINISIDGLAEAHERVRGSGTFARTVEGYRKLRAADEDAGQTRRKICANVLLHRHNLADFPELLAFLAEEGFSGVQVLTLFRNEADPTAGGMWFAPDQLDAVEALCERLATGDTPLPLLNRAADLRLIARYFRDGLRPLDAPCWAGWKELYINADGGAIMCDGKLDFLAGRFGDVRKSTLQELWASDSLRARRAVVKTCTTPCIQACYLRRESDSLAGIGAEALDHLRNRLPRTLREIPETLTLELSDVMDDPGDPRSRWLFARAGVDVTALWEDPDRMEELRDRKYIDFGRGFMGAGVVGQLVDAVRAAGLGFAAVALRWRGEPLLHPEFPEVYERLLAAVDARIFGRIVVETSGRVTTSRQYAALAAGRATDLWVRDAARVEAHPGARLGVAEANGAVVSWDGWLVERDDRAVAHPIGDVLKERFGTVWARRGQRSPRTAGSAGTAHVG